MSSEALDYKTIFDRDVDEVRDHAAKPRIERPVLIVFDEKDLNRRHPIDKSLLEIGRDLLAEITIQDSRCSRRHARIVYENRERTDQAPRVKLVDLGSTNGTYVNGERVVGERMLEDRDKIMMGSTVFGFFLRDEFELAADQRLMTMANVDALTGLSNRAVFDREIISSFNQADRLRRPLSLVLFDIDHFKKFNDTYGHQTGDYVLRELGKIVGQNVRGGDIPARYGGEEFAIILAGTPLQGAIIQAERLRTSVSHHRFELESHPLHLTVSVGIATFEDGYDNVEQFINAADKALYRAKSEGRNRVCWMRDGELGASSDQTLPISFSSPSSQPRKTRPA